MGPVDQYGNCKIDRRISFYVSKNKDNKYQSLQLVRTAEKETEN